MITMNLPTLFMIAFVSGVGAYFGSYLREKGKNLATKEDVAAISRTTEAIKDEIAHGAWVKKLKWECYSKLAEDLGELTALLQEVLFFTKRGPVPGFSQADIDERRERNRAAANATMERHRRYASIARIVVPAEVRTFLSKFADDMIGSILVEDQYKVAHKAWVELLDLARADLTGEPRETPTVTKRA